MMVTFLDHSTVHGILIGSYFKKFADHSIRKLLYCPSINKERLLLHQHQKFDTESGNPEKKMKVFYIITQGFVQ